MAALAGTRQQDLGAACGMVNVTEKSGGSLGLAIVLTEYSTATKNSARHPVAHLPRLAQQHQAIVHGMTSAFTLAVVFDVLALLIVLLIIRDRAPRPADRAPQPANSALEPAEEAF